MVPDAINGEAVQFAHRIFQTFSAYKLVRFLIFESLKDDLTRVECSPGEIRTLVGGSKALYA